MCDIRNAIASQWKFIFISIKTETDFMRSKQHQTLDTNVFSTASKKIIPQCYDTNQIYVIIFTVTEDFIHIIHPYFAALTVPF